MDKNIDIDIDALNNLCKKYQTILQNIGDISVNGNGEPFNYYNRNYSDKVKSKIELIRDNIQTIIASIKEFVLKIENADIGNDEMYSFFTNLLEEINNKREVITADIYLIEEWVKNRDDVTLVKGDDGEVIVEIKDENGNVIYTYDVIKGNLKDKNNQPIYDNRIDDMFNINLEGYEYNIKTHYLTGPFDDKMKVFYYLPKDCVNINELDTVTMLGGDGDGANTFNNILNDKVISDKLIICPNPYVKKEYKEWVTWPIPSVTEFGNIITGNKLALNTIIGCSKGGAGAFLIPARNPGIYDKIEVFNYEPLCSGFNGSKKGETINLILDDDIKSLIDQGIELNYVNCAGDKNIGGQSELFIDSLNHILDVYTDYGKTESSFKINLISNCEDPDNDIYKSFTFENHSADIVNLLYGTEYFADFFNISLEEAAKFKGHGSSDEKSNGYHGMTKAYVQR